MNGQKRPKRFVSILITVAAVCSLVTSLLMVAKVNSSLVLTLQLFSTLLLAIAAIINWYQYSKQYVEYEVERRMKQENPNI